MNIPYYHGELVMIELYHQVFQLLNSFLLNRTRTRLICLSVSKQDIQLSRLPRIKKQEHVTEKFV